MKINLVHESQSQTSFFNAVQDIVKEIKSNYKKTMWSVDEYKSNFRSRKPEEIVSSKEFYYLAI